jgi:putative aldouronate transport system permease protein
MLFSGGLIPTYMTVYKTGLMGTIWALVLPGAVPLFNVIVLLNFFRDIPGEIEEAAFIDGASYWNAWFDGLIYNNRAEGYPLQSYMQTVLVAMDFSRLNFNEILRMAQISDRTIKASQVFLGCMPVLLVYPFLQRYFTKGLVLGSVKG